MTQIGKNIKKIRSVRGLSQQAFADIFELTRGNISSYEESRAEPRIETIVKIANYFGIPLNDFIQKDLSVNELLHYNAELVLETEKLKINNQLVKVPFVPAIYINDYLQQYNDDNFVNQLPHIVFPSSSKFRLLAIEVDDAENLPSGFNFHNGDVLIYENVVKENLHRIQGRLGMMFDGSELKAGIYNIVKDQIVLTLNEWVKYPFDIESDNQYWVLRAYCTQNI